MLRVFRCLATLVALIGMSLSASANDTNYVFYTAKTVKWGSASQQVVLPQTYPSRADLTISSIVSEAFHRLKSNRGGAYADATLTLDPQFASTGAVTVMCGNAASGELHVVVSEIYWTMVAAGVREVRMPEISAKPISAKDVALGVAGLRMQLWQVLPPGTPGYGQVIIGGKLDDAANVARKLAAKDRGATNAVIALLNSPLAFVRMKAISAISRLKLGGADNALIARLQDKDTAVKKAVIKAFAGTRSKRVLSALEQVVQKDPDPTVQSAAVRVLNAAGVTKYAVFALFDKLKDPDDGVVMDAVEKLSKEKKPEVAMALIGVLSHRNSQIRTMGMKGIVAFKNKAALLKVLGSDQIDMSFRNQAATELAKEANDDGDKGLKHLCANGDVSAVIKAAKTISDRRRYRLTGDLIGLLKHRNGQVRLAAAKALGEIKDSKALVPLCETANAHPKQKDALEAAVLAIFAGLSLDEAIKRSEAKNARLRQLALKSMSRFAQGSSPNPRVLQVLKKRLADTDPAIRHSAAFALARIKDAGVTASLVKLKADPDGVIREQVAVSLSHSRHPQADALLITFLDDSSPGAQRAAIEGVRIRKITKGLQKIKFLVQSRNVGVRRAAFHAIYDLAGIPGWDAYFGIRQGALFDTDSEVKIWAARGIAQKQDPRVPSLLDTLVTDRDIKVQLVALEALGKSGQPSAVEYIANGLMDSKKKVKSAALDALEALNLEAGKKPIMEFVKNETDKALVARANDVYDNLP